MILSSKAPTTRVRRAIAGAAAALAVLATVAACGGGTSQYEPFEPKRLFAFGDESSHLSSTGRKYGVNVLATGSTTAIDCTLDPLWVQAVASVYGLVFAECNPGNAASPQARMYAAPGAKVADFEAQINAQVTAGGFTETDLATVLVGANDVLALYAQYPTRSEESLLAEARERGAALARAVNRLIGLGAKVILSNLPDMGLSPYALAQRGLYTDTDRAALITRLTTAFNEQLGVTVLLDGRYVGLVQADLSWQAIGRFPSFYGMANITEGICTVALPDCTSATLRVIDTATGALAAPSSYLWADGTRMAYGGQLQLAGLAVDRARRNPF
jgi:outer membrane lipase/esterase